MLCDIQEDKAILSENFKRVNIKVRISNPYRNIRLILKVTIFSWNQNLFLDVTIL